MPVDEHAVADNNKLVGLRVQPWRTVKSVGADALHAVGDFDFFQRGMTEGFGADCQQPVGQHDALDRVGTEIADFPHGTAAQFGGYDDLLRFADVAGDHRLAALGQEAVIKFVVAERLFRRLFADAPRRFFWRAGEKRRGAEQRAEDGEQQRNALVLPHIPFCHRIHLSHGIPVLHKSLFQNYPNDVFCCPNSILDKPLGIVSITLGRRLQPRRQF